MRTVLTSLLLAGAVFGSMGATNCGQIIDDSGFDLWCGPDLCKWQVEEGEIRKVPTWHASDAGVELLGTEAKISQLTDVNNFDGTCVRFQMVVDVDEAVDLRLQMDVWGDGTYEYDERIPTSDWRALTYLVRMPATYDGVRFRLYKQGTGRTVLANIGAEIADDSECTTPALVVTPPAAAPGAARSPTRSPVAAGSR
ncbi:MAG TPA: hypothetical protein VHE35_27640 [Kofleriaceae bacterium]|nr:hypothetical protein [Kofleriaceae bacterium]